jgi:hypothetical protein
MAPARCRNVGERWWAVAHKPKLDNPDSLLGLPPPTRPADRLHPLEPRLPILRGYSWDSVLGVASADWLS